MEASWREVEVAGPAGTIAAMDWGATGDPLLLIHGGGSNAAEWASTVPYLVDRFRCISFDSGGHGRSAEPPELGFGLLLEEIDAVVDHFDLDAERLALVGSSFGGALAVWWASTRAGCRALVGVDSAPARIHLEPWPPASRVDPGPDAWRALGWGWAGDQAGYEARVAEAVADGGLEAQARRAHTRGNDGVYRSHPSAEIVSALGNLGSRPDNPIVDMENYTRLRCPTLLLCATDGASADNREFIDTMPTRFPCVEVVWVEGPHTLNYEHPELVARHIGRFLEG